MKVNLVRNMLRTVLLNRTTVVLAVFILGCSAGQSINVYAGIDELTVRTGCGQGSSYTGVLGLEQSSYDAYVQLGKRGQSASVTGYAQSYGTNAVYGVCDPIGTVQANGDSWTLLGSIKIDAAQGETIQISSPLFEGIPDANRPSVLLVPKTNPLCVPSDECRIKIGDSEGYVRPISTRLNQDSLKLAVVTDPAEDTVVQVRYYADDELVYSTKQLKDFDLRYVAYPQQKLTRVVEYKSGQQIVLTGSSSNTHTDSFANFIFRLSQKYPKVFMATVWLGGILIIGALGLLAARMYNRRRSWRIHHGFIAEPKSGLIMQAAYAVRAWKGFQVIKYGVVVLGLSAGILVVIVAVTQWGAQIITVDGRSMESMYSTGDQVLVNKLPKTFADINNGEYIPKRGEVVVVRANFGNSRLDLGGTEAPLIIKRVLALPGERVTVKDGVLTVFNKEFPEGFSPDNASSWQSTMTPDNPNESIDIQLATTELFLGGDNRPESIDSRFNGPLLTKEVVGLVATSF